MLVLGDLMLDRFIWGKVNRISPEAPVPVVHVTHETAYPGGAANVARNLAEFGIQGMIGGMIGNDDNGEILTRLLKESHITTDGILQCSSYPTIVKTRIIARHQQVVRVDREKKQQPSPAEIQQLVNRLDDILPNVDAVIMEDYAKGFLSQELADRVISLARQHNKIITVDPNPGNPVQWSGTTLIKPNRYEALVAAGIPPDQEDVEWQTVGDKLIKQWNTANILITLGEKGMILFHPPDEPYFTPTRAREVYDVSGAGDTVIAFFTASLAAGLDWNDAAEIANHAASVVVAKLGTATVKPDELIQNFKDHE